MYNNLVIIKIFFAYFLPFSLQTNNLLHSVPITSCSQTPYPEVCKSFVDHNNLLSTKDEKSKFSFLELALRITLEQAIEAHKLVSTMNLIKFSYDRSKLARDDCLELYKDTIDKLNRSLNSINIINYNPIDTQTWLSASIANQQTCQNGFIEVEGSCQLNYFPSMLSNFSKLLSNSLAIHKASTSTMLFNKQVGRRRLMLSEEFPEWVSAADRKLVQSGATPIADVVVAQDGSGNYRTIGEAMVEAGKLSKGKKRTAIYVKAGVYKENVEIKKSYKNLMFVGDGIDATIVTGNKNNQEGSTTFRSATFGVSGDGFIARDMTFENTAGPQKHQAVALRSSSDHSVFYRCSFKGYQDTLYLHSHRQFYRECDIFGTVDFIFGDAIAVLQNCNIYVRKPMTNQKNTITSQARADPNENTGIIIHNSRIIAAPEFRAVQNSFETYLGRPWKKYSRTVIMKSEINGFIKPTGWLPWSGSFGLSTLYYAEFMNTGDGAGTEGRVKWPGYHVLTSVTEARKFTVENFLAGESWISVTHVPFEAGL